jgi:hypothetical protein
VARWTTQAEGDLLSFEVQRTTGAQVHDDILDLPYTGTWARVSPLIDGQGKAGGVYTFVDETALPGVPYAYMLAALGQDNHLRLFGPRVAVTASPYQQTIMLPFVAAQ